MYHPSIPTPRSKESGPRSLVAQHPDVQPWLAPSADIQRARILEAIIAVVAERGYATATVSDIVRRAHVSRTTFYELYDGKESCFADACEHGFAVLEAQIRQAAAASTGGWKEEVRAAIHAYLTTLADEPLFARAFLVEVQAAGGTALQVREKSRTRVVERFKTTLEHAREENPALREPPDAALKLVGAGGDQLAASYVVEGRGSSLAELEPVLVDAYLSITLGPDR